MKASFYIWLARKSSGWSSKTSLITIEDTVLSAAGSKNTNTSRDSCSSNKGFLSSQSTRNLRKNNQCTKHPGFFNKTHAMQTQFYKLWVQSHHSGVNQLLSQVSYHPWPEQWLWICHLWKDELLLWILWTFCGHFIGNSQPISRYLSSLTPNRMSLRSFK